MSSVRRITVVEMTPEGPQAHTVMKQEDKRKVARRLKPLERATRRALEAQSAYVETALAEHEKRTHKRGDRWLTETPTIVLKASRKAFKRLYKL